MSDSIKEITMKKYVSYETDIYGTYTEHEFYQLYVSLVDKHEYEAFDDWRYDMIRSGVFELL